MSTARGPTLLEIPYTSDEIFRNLHRNPEILAEIPKSLLKINVLKSLSRRLLLYWHYDFGWNYRCGFMVGVSTDPVGVAQLNCGCGLFWACVVSHLCTFELVWNLEILRNLHRNLEISTEILKSRLKSGNQTEIWRNPEIFLEIQRFRNPVRYSFLWVSDPSEHCIRSKLSDLEHRKFSAY